MALRTKKSLFYHIPKTGGLYVRKAMRIAEIEYHECYSYGKNRFGLATTHAAYENLSDRDRFRCFSFCFVRHPVQWYRSIWAYRLKTNSLNDKFPPDQLWDERFEVFVENMVSKYPDGFLSELYFHYTDNVNFVGRQENLVDDLVKALYLEEFSEMQLRNTSKENVTIEPDNEYDRLTFISEAMKREIESAEHIVMHEFYNDF